LWTRFPFHLFVKQGAPPPKGPPSRFLAPSFVFVLIAFFLQRVLQAPPKTKREFLPTPPSDFCDFFLRSPLFKSFFFVYPPAPFVLVPPPKIHPFFAPMFSQVLSTFFSSVVPLGSHEICHGFSDLSFLRPMLAFFYR